MARGAADGGSGPTDGVEGDAGTLGIPAITTETEDNGISGSAPVNPNGPVGNNVTVSAQINPANDIDVYWFRGLTNAQISITVTALSSGFDMDWYAYKYREGEPVDWNAPLYKSNAFGTAPAAGTAVVEPGQYYLLLVNAYEATSSTSYSVEMTGPAGALDP